jgi:uncharacterized protein YjdB
MSACRDKPTELPPAVASVLVALEHDTLRWGDETTASATLLSDRGQPLSDRTVAWKSLDTLTATVSARGVIFAVSPGTATITATSEGKEGSASLVVTHQLPGTIAVSPVFSEITVGDSLSVVATVTDQGGATIPAPDIVWTSNPASVATVTSRGMVNAKASGVVTISGRAGGVSAIATLQVVAPLSERGIELVASVHDAVNSPTPVAEIPALIGELLSAGQSMSVEARPAFYARVLREAFNGVSDAQRRVIRTALQTWDWEYSLPTAARGPSASIGQRDLLNGIRSIVC